MAMSKSTPGSQYTMGCLYIKWPKTATLPAALDVASRDGTATLDTADGKHRLLKRMLLDADGLKALLDATAAGTITSADVLTPEEAKALMPVDQLDDSPQAAEK